jgi:uncharacterized damage-inducible protein DinB
MFPVNVRKYQFATLTGTPDVLDHLLSQVPADSPVWDARPDPERFTIREVLAHIADWEPIFLERVTRTAEMERPPLQGYDEGQFAIDRDYAHSDPHANLKRFRQGRETLIAFLRSQPDTAWDRVGVHTELGPITLEGQLGLIVGHDGYHTAQIVQWLQSAEK